MATLDAARLKTARSVVADVLAKKTTAANTPALVADDLLTLNVALLEQHDAAWLEAQLKDARIDAAMRTVVALQLRGPLRRPLLTALGAPPFVIGR
jgi:hypothetical protein